MYLLNELLMTLPLVLYVLLRIRKLISRPLYKNLFVVF
jgi:hypothetical protein